MRRAIDSHAPGDRPQLADVEGALGSLASPPSAAEGQTRTRRRGSAPR
jgi:hypothetical protein